MFLHLKIFCYIFTYTLNRYPTPHIVSIYCGLDVSTSTFSRIFLDMHRYRCDIPDGLHIPDLPELTLLFEYTWFGWLARNVSRSNSFVVNVRSSPFTHTRLAVVSIFSPLISITLFFSAALPVRRSYLARCAFYSRHQFTWTKRLCHIIIRTESQYPLILSISSFFADTITIGVFFTSRT